MTASVLEELFSFGLIIGPHQSLGHNAEETDARTGSCRISLYVLLDFLRLSVSPQSGLSLS